MHIATPFLLRRVRWCLEQQASCSNPEATSQYSKDDSTERCKRCGSLRLSRTCFLQVCVLLSEIIKSILYSWSHCDVKKKKGHLVQEKSILNWYTLRRKALPFFQVLENRRVWFKGSFTRVLPHKTNKQTHLLADTAIPHLVITLSRTCNNNIFNCIAPALGIVFESALRENFLFGEIFGSQFQIILNIFTYQLLQVSWFSHS